MFDAPVLESPLWLWWVAYCYWIVPTMSLEICDRIYFSCVLGGGIFSFSEYAGVLIVPVFFFVFFKNISKHNLFASRIFCSCIWIGSCRITQLKLKWDCNTLLLIVWISPSRPVFLSFWDCLHFTTIIVCLIIVSAGGQSSVRSTANTLQLMYLNGTCTYSQTCQ